MVYTKESVEVGEKSKLLQVPVGIEVLLVKWLLAKNEKFCEGELAFWLSG